MLSEETLVLLERYRRGDLDDDSRVTLEERLENEPQLAELLAELEADAELESELVSISGLLRRQHQTTNAVKVEGFHVIDEVHRGGQGVVFRAVEEQTHRPVALKLLLSGAHATRRERLRFEREIELAANLQHPNIVAVFHTGTTPEGHQYFVMPLIDGIRLDEYVDEEGLSVRATLRLFLKIAAAVHHAHQRGIIHRDLKPGNILVDQDGEPHVLDFGLAKPFGLTTTTEESLVTRTGEFAGTLAYASPEQIQGEHDRIEVRSDVYALGVVLYGLVAGRFPYPVDGPITDVADNIVEFIPERPSSHRPEIAADVDVIVLKAIAKEIDRRYDTVAHFARDIELYLAGLPIEAKSDSGWYVLKKTLSRYRLAAAAIAGLILVLATATVISLKFWRDAEERRAQAETARERALYEGGVRGLVSQFAWEMVSAVDVETLQEAASRIDDFEDGLSRAILHDQFGMAFFRLKELDLAELHLTKAIDLYADHRDIEEFGYRRTCKNRAVVYLEQGRTEEAEQELRAFIDWVNGQQGFQQPGLKAAAPADLGFALHQLRRFAEAEELLRPALAEAIALHGKDSLRAQRIRRSLGATLVGLDRLGEAAVILDEAVDCASGRRPPDTLDLVLCQSARADCAREANRAEESIRLLEHSLELCRQSGAIDEEVTLTTMNNLAGALVRARRPGEAIALFEEVLERQRGSLGEEHPQTLFTKNNLAQALGKEGRHDEAAALTREVVDVFRRKLGVSHSDTLNAVNSLGWQTGKAGRQEEAVTLMGDVIREVLDAEGDRAHWMVHYMRVNRAVLLCEISRVEEAEQEMLASYDELADRLGPGHALARSTAQFLAKIYEVRGDTERAERYRALGAAGKQ